MSALGEAAARRGGRQPSATARRLPEAMMTRPVTSWDWGDASHTRTGDTHAGSKAPDRAWSVSPSPTASVVGVRAVGHRAFDGDAVPASSRAAMIVSEAMAALAAP
jgi:hypothetical protein